MRALFIFIFGSCRFRVKGEYAASLLELLKRIGATTRSQRFEEGYLCFSATLLTSRKITAECERAEIPLELVKKQGLPSLLRRYRLRIGIPVGALICCLLIYFSGKVVWDIRVEGNERLTDAEVINELRECGFSVGCVRSRADTHTVENRVMIHSEDISWISVNIIGTVAEVEIRESEITESTVPDYAASNVVAARDGDIELFEDVRGNILLDIGDHVREGELIISGLYGSETEGFRYTAARGRVLARTQREISVSVPLDYRKKTYTGRVYTEKYLVFFEKEIKFFGKCGNLYTTCDTIDTVEYLNFFSGGELPIGIRTVRYLEYTVEDAQRSENEAMELAFYKLETELMAVSESAELLRKRTEFSVRDGEVSLVCRLEVIEDIAKIKEIEISTAEEEWNRGR